MNPGQAQSLESLFGPPSELIDIRQFIEAALPLGPSENPDDLMQIPCEIQDECSIEDVRESLSEVWNNPVLSAHLTKDHERMVSALHSSVNISGKGSKRTRKSENAMVSGISASSDINDLQRELDTVEVNCFRLDTKSTLLMRTSKNSDYNVLSSTGPLQTSEVSKSPRDAIITVSVYGKVAWGTSYVTRSSQMALLSSQTLDDLYRSINCVAKNLPSGYRTQTPGYAIFLEGKIYQNGEQDGYAEKLLVHLESTPKKQLQSTLKSQAPLQSCRVDTLAVRLNEPYWMVHSGNCEHFVIFDQIRLSHLTDPPQGYPFILHQPSTLLDLCRGCTKVPAVWSIVGDERLGESPCVLCGSCWKNMGISNDDDVLVVPITMPTSLKEVPLAGQ